jgi:hypothetical protein
MHLPARSLIEFDSLRSFVSWRGAQTVSWLIFVGSRYAFLSRSGLDLSPTMTPLASRSSWTVLAHQLALAAPGNRSSGRRAGSARGWRRELGPSRPRERRPIRPCAGGVHRGIDGLDQAGMVEVLDVEISSVTSARSAASASVKGGGALPCTHVRRGRCMSSSASRPVAGSTPSLA